MRAELTAFLREADRPLSAGLAGLDEIASTANWALPVRLCWARSLLCAAYYPVPCPTAALQHLWPWTPYHSDPARSAHPRCAAQEADQQLIQAARLKHEREQQERERSEAAEADEALNPEADPDAAQPVEVLVDPREFENLEDDPELTALVAKLSRTEDVDEGKGRISPTGAWELGRDPELDEVRSLLLLCPGCSS